MKSFCDSLDAKLTAVKNKQNNNYEIVLVGDFNINYRTPSNSDTKSLEWFEQRLSLKQIITNVKRFSNLNSCIDLIFTDNLTVADHGTLNVNLSDHEMLFVTRKHVSKPKVPSSFEGRSYIDYDEIQFVTSLKDKDWDLFYDSVNPNAAWYIMKQTIVSVIDTMCPIRYKKT